MKILITWSKWHADIGEGYANAFRSLGHEAEVFYDNPSHWTRFYEKAFRRVGASQLSRRALTWYSSTVNQQFLNKARSYKPDFIFVIKGTHFARATIETIRTELKIPVANWIIDDPAFINQFEPLTHESYAAYSHLFIVDPAWSWYVQQLTGKQPVYLPHAADEKLYHPLASKKDIDVFFVGSLALKYPNQASGLLRATLLNQLAEKGIQITAVAPGVDETFTRFPALKKCELITNYVKPTVVNEYYNRSKIVLNINAPQLKTEFSDRLAAIALTKSFQLVDAKSGMEHWFGKDGVTWSFERPADLVKKVSYYLSHEQERNAIAAHTYGRALELHTYKNRSAAILKNIYAN